MSHINPAFGIARNFPHCDEHSDESFLGKLHEEHLWDAAEFWKWDAALYALARELDGAPEFPRELAWRVLRVFSHTMLLISCHFDSNDGCRIKNLTDEQFYNWRERLQLVTEGFFEGKMPDDAIFDLRNPLFVDK